MFSVIIIISIGCPKILRSDRGTENSLISILQPILRHHHSDSLAGRRSFIYGRSIGNQVSVGSSLKLMAIYIL